MENPFEFIIEKLNTIEHLLKEIKQNSTNLENEKNEDEILNMVQTSKFLNLSKPTLYGFTGKRTIPHYKTGKRIYFKKSELIEWITKDKIKTEEELNNEAETYLIKRKRR